MRLYRSSARAFLVLFCIIALLATSCAAPSTLVVLDASAILRFDGDCNPDAPCTLNRCFPGASTTISSSSCNILWVSNSPTESLLLSGLSTTVSMISLSLTIRGPAQSLTVNVPVTGDLSIFGDSPASTITYVRLPTIAPTSIVLLDSLHFRPQSSGDSIFASVSSPSEGPWPQVTIRKCVFYEANKRDENLASSIESRETYSAKDTLNYAHERNVAATRNAIAYDGGVVSVLQCVVYSVPTLVYGAQNVTVDGLTNITVSQALLESNRAQLVMIFNSILFGASSATLISAGNGTPFLHISRSRLSSFSLVPIQFTGLDIIDSSIYDTSWKITSSALLDNSLFLGQGSLVVEGVQPIVMQNLIVRNSGGIFFASTPNLPTPSTLYTNNITLNNGISVFISNLFMDDNGVIATINPSATQSSIGAAPGPSTWSLPQMHLDNVRVTSTIEMLRYRLSNLSTSSDGVSCSYPPCFTYPPSNIVIESNNTNVLTRQLVTTVDSTKVSFDTKFNSLTEPDNRFSVTLGFTRQNGDTEIVFTSSRTPTQSPPLSPPVPQNPNCPPGFTCDGSGASTPGNIDAPTLVIPPQYGHVTIGGNLTISENLIIPSTDTSITVSGCAYINNIEIDITTISSGSTKTLVVQNGANCASLGSSSLKVVDRSKDCKKRSATFSKSDSNRLSVIFSVNSSACNTKWIILGAVLGGLVLLALIGLILLFTLNKNARQCVRPYSKRRAAE